MTHWLRFEAAGVEHFGTLENEIVTVWIGNMFADPHATAQQFALAEVRILMPCRPSKMIGLWNNFHERATKEGLHRPEHPLYFLKSSNCFAGHGDTIRRPAGYHDAVVFEAELGIVIGRRCKAVTVAEAPAAIFGYTCVNDVTARDVMRLDPAFVHWTRAKSFDTFGVFGPVIATGLDPASLRVGAVISGEARQDYPVSDMFFSPAEIVCRISHDMTLEAGDVIACGTSVGAGPLAAGDTVEVVIDGIGRLVNTFN